MKALRHLRLRRRLFNKFSTSERDAAEGSSAQLYLPLDATRSEIRFLEILPSDDLDAPIRCTMRTVSMDDEPVYTALSYVWGDPMDTEDISVNGNVLTVPKNLVSALRHLRDPRTLDTTTLWVDAICINQRDLEERSSQVLLMGRLFRNAQLTIGWLGPASDDSGYAIKIIHKIFDAMPKDDPVAIPPPYFLDDFEWLQHIPELWEENPTEPLFNSTWPCLIRFMQRDYWERAWILQEIVLSKRMVFLCGFDSMKWVDIAIFSGIWFTLKNRPDEVHLPGKIPKRMQHIARAHMVLLDRSHTAWLIRATLPSKLTDNLIDLVKLTTSLRATDPRDKIYALLGICQSDVVADYTTSNTTYDVYTKFAIKMIEQENSLGLFRYCCPKGRDVRIEPDHRQLPSWVPDWRVVDRYGILPFMKHFTSVPSGLYLHQFDDDHGVLHVNGVIVDKITEHTLDEDSAEHLKDVCKFVAPYLSERVASSMGMSNLQAVYRILRLDNSLKPSTSWDKPAFFEWTAGFFSYFVGRIGELDSMDEQSALEKACAYIGVPTGATFRSSLLETLFGPGAQSESPVLWSTAAEAVEFGRKKDVFGNFAAEAFSSVSRKSIFHTPSGYLGLCQRELEAEDVVCVVFGCSDPVVLRPVGAQFIVVGTCFVPGLTEGEVWGACNNIDASLASFDGSTSLKIQQLELC